MISHQGSFKKKNSLQLDFLKNFLKLKLKTKLVFLKNKKKAFNKKNLELIKPGEILVLPNIRFFKGEELNSKALAKKISKLGNCIVLGGFSKAHRENSSNNAILNFLPGYMSNGIYNELKLLQPWLNPEPGSMLILGGEKIEKINIGLKYLSKKYQFILPTGIVLNTILKLKGFNIGLSKYHKGKKENDVVKNFINDPNKKILIPKKMIVFSKQKIKKKEYIELNKIKQKHIIGGFFLTSIMIKIIKNCLKRNKNIIIAGTPSLISKKCFQPTQELSTLIEKNNKKVLLLGGDTVSDLKFSGKKSSGGGSALYYLSKKSLPILKTLYKNQIKFNVV